MTTRPTPPRWLSNRTGLTLLAVVSSFFGALILLPYLQYVLLGVVLAYILMPAQRRLETVTGSMAAALMLVVVAILAILLPTAYVLAIAFREALELLSAVQAGTLGMDEIEQRLEATGYGVDLVDLYDTYQEPIGTALQGLATSGIELVSGLPGILIGLTVTLFVLFALLRDGDQLVAWSRSVIPIDDRIQRELLAKLDQLMWASVVGNVAVAIIQAIALGIGLAVLGVPALVFLTVATFVLALLPLIGAFGVWVPVAIYLAVIGDFVGAAALVAYGSLVSASDTYLRPALIGRTSAFNSAIVVVGIFGGIIVFGAVGLFIGPVVLGGAKVTLDAFARERTPPSQRGPLTESEDGSKDPAVDTASDTGVRSEVAKESDTEPAESRGEADETDRQRGDQSENGDDSGAESNSDDQTGADQVDDTDGNPSGDP